MLSFGFLLCSAFGLIATASCAIGSEINMTPVIQTLSGPVIGLVKNIPGSKVNSFVGIPYAKPPVDDLRLMKPQPMDKWTDVVEATELPPVCMQPRLPLLYIRQKMSEDCLYLNILTPGDALMNKGQKYPVMVSIFHADYTILSGNDEWEYKSELVKRQNIILVTLNSRLNFFGYAATPEENGIESNLGLWDENFAIRWVNNNIEFFGGDKEALAIRGQGSGSANVIAHVLSPYARNLFQNAIAEDQDILNQGEHARDRVYQSTQILLNRIGCSSPKNRIQCIRDADANDIISALPRRFSAFSQVYDPNYFTIAGFNEKVAESANDVNLLLGFPTDYSSRYLAITVPQLYSKVDLNYEDALRALEYFVDSGKVDKIARTFIGDPNQPLSVKKIQDGLVRFLNEVVPCVLYNTAYLAGESKNFKSGVYTYEFNHIALTNDFKLCDIDRELGVCTRAQLLFVFGYPYSDYYWLFTDGDRRMSDIMMDIYGSFMRTGEPRLPNGKEWPNWNDPKSKNANIATVILDAKNGGIIDKNNPKFCLDNLSLVNSSLIPKFHPYDPYDIQSQRKMDSKSSYTGFLYQTLKALYFADY